MSEEQYAKRQKRPRTRAETPPPSPTHTKYKNRPTGGYASVKEARRAGELKLMFAAGKIHTLCEQVKFLLIPAQYVNGRLKERACHYVADFTYWIGSTPCIEDVKSPASKTAAYIIKRKLMLERHKLTIIEM